MYNCTLEMQICTLIMAMQCICSCGSRGSYEYTVVRDPNYSLTLNDPTAPLNSGLRLIRRC